MGRSAYPVGCKQPEERFMETFEDDMKSLSKELRWILASDMITAFRNRLVVFERLQSKQVSVGTRR